MVKQIVRSFLIILDAITADRGTHDQPGWNCGGGEASGLRGKRGAVCQTLIKQKGQSSALGERRASTRADSVSRTMRAVLNRSKVRRFLSIMAVVLLRAVYL